MPSPVTSQSDRPGSGRYKSTAGIRITQALQKVQSCQGRARDTAFARDVREAEPEDSSVDKQFKIIQKSNEIKFKRSMSAQQGEVTGGPTLREYTGAAAGGATAGEASGTKSSPRAGWGEPGAEGGRARKRLPRNYAAVRPLTCFCTSGSAGALSTPTTRSTAAAQGTKLEGPAGPRGAIFRSLCPLSTSRDLRVWPRPPRAWPSRPEAGWGIAAG